jgi:hypothetical protein
LNQPFTRCTIILEVTSVLKARHIKRGGSHRRMPCSYTLYITLLQVMICVMWHCVFIRTPMQFHFSDQFCLPQAQYKNCIWSTVACTIPNILPLKSWVMIHSHLSPQSFYCSCSITKSLDQNLHANYCSRILYQDQIQGGFFGSLVFNHYKSYLLVWFLIFVVRSFGFL